uniref:Uncharacterized protein n=1 Tax=Peronospora matthiolae TaxID=2874970 RepID=A0AAV1U280_9STRA
MFHFKASNATEVSPRTQRGRRHTNKKTAHSHRLVGGLWSKKPKHWIVLLVGQVRGPSEHSGTGGPVVASLIRTDRVTRVFQYIPLSLTFDFHSNNPVSSASSTDITEAVSLDYGRTCWRHKRQCLITCQSALRSVVDQVLKCTTAGIWTRHRRDCRRLSGNERTLTRFRMSASVPAEWDDHRSSSDSCDRSTASLRRRDAEAARPVEICIKALGPCRLHSRALLFTRRPRSSRGFDAKC